VSVPGPSSGAHENLRSQFEQPFRVARVLWPLGIQPEEERRFAARGRVLGCLVARMLGFVAQFLSSIAAEFLSANEEERGATEERSGEVEPTTGAFDSTTLVEDTPSKVRNF
jgi:hypothetical protein